MNRSAPYHAAPPSRTSWRPACVCCITLHCGLRDPDAPPPFYGATCSPGAKSCPPPFGGSAARSCRWLVPHTTSVASTIRDASDNHLRPSASPVRSQQHERCEPARLPRSIPLRYPRQIHEPTALYQLPLKCFPGPASVLTLYLTAAVQRRGLYRAPNGQPCAQ
ncbi:hypothetical protein C8R43DRAFT_1022507 [Mycena crocata]|nr:hypothetical protein C8R43DRAFT_1022507 [Mycena crocata]